MSQSDPADGNNSTLAELRVAGPEFVVARQGTFARVGSMSNDPVTMQIPRITDAPVTLQVPAYTANLYGAIDPIWLTGQKGHAWRRTTGATPYHPYPARVARPRRRPAPLGIRIVVGLLFVVFVSGVSGLFVMHDRPSLVKSFRHYLTFTEPRPKATPVASFHVAPSGLKYFVPARSYSIGVNISHPCWIIVQQLGSGATLFASTLQPVATEQYIRVTGSTSIKVAARTNSITIRTGTHTLGSIENPVVGATYDLVAEPH